MSEKERVYTELHRTQRKCAALKAEVERLKRATTAAENAALRREAASYRAALSNIKYRIERGDTDGQALLGVCEAALALRGMKGHQRKQIEQAHAHA